MFAPIKLTVKVTQGAGGMKNIAMLDSASKRRVLRAMGRKFYEITMGTFGAGGTNRAAPWPPLDHSHPDRPTYQRSIGYFGPPKLVLRGDLRASIRVISDNDQYVEVGTDNPYAGVHQFGGGNNIPSRPFFPIQFQGTSYRLTPYAQKQLEEAAMREITQMSS